MAVKKNMYLFYRIIANSFTGQLCKTLKRKWIIAFQYILQFYTINYFVLKKKLLDNDPPPFEDMSPNIIFSLLFAVLPNPIQKIKKTNCTKLLF